MFRFRFLTDSAKTAQYSIYIESITRRFRLKTARSTAAGPRGGSDGRVVVRSWPGRITPTRTDLRKTNDTFTQLLPISFRTPWPPRRCCNMIFRAPRSGVARFDVFSVSRSRLPLPLPESIFVCPRYRMKLLRPSGSAGELRRTAPDSSRSPRRHRRRTVTSHSMNPSSLAAQACHPPASACFFIGQALHSLAYRAKLLQPHGSVLRLGPA